MNLSLSPSGELLLSIPSVLAEGRTQELTIPCTVEGLRVIRRILRERVADAEVPSLGKPSEPVASMIAEFLAQERAQKDEERQRRIAQKARIADEILDLAGIDLEL